MSKRLRAPTWLAPILIWYEQTMRDLSRWHREGDAKIGSSVVNARHWWRHFEQPGQMPLKPIVLSDHARERYIERYAADPNHLDLEAFRFMVGHAVNGSMIVTNGSVYFVVSRERNCYRAITALTPTMVEAEASSPPSAAVS